MLQILHADLHLGYPAGEPRASKKQRLRGDIPHYNLGPSDGLWEQTGDNKLKVDSEAQLLAREEMSLASKEKKLAEEKIALEKERLNLEKKKLALESDRFALEKKKLAVEDEKIPPSPASTVSM